MAELILHHYPESPFSEKVRAILGAKGLPWRSLQVSMVMPRPATIALTGGYRRIPVLQVGADVYCDTALIAEYLDHMGSGPSLFPAGNRLAAQTLARWVDTELFWAAVTLRFLPENMGGFFADPASAQAFAEDRANFAQGAQVRRPPVDEAKARYARFLAEMEAQLGDGRPYLFGAEWSVADFAVYHMLWFIHAGGGMADWLASRAHISAWMDRMRAFGQHGGEDIEADEALAIAREADPLAIDLTSDLPGIPPGTTVDVAPVDYGVMPSRGTLLHCDTDSIVIRREHALTGAVNVHFPRHGFGVKRGD
ncbi:glutathione S-transferase family protein [Novosphingobium sp.]|uniref:glutathione S-transferase family protein n=1 Tax=Novosphingobium sp. TaxID=1874826 RepID=UPI003BAA873A